MVPLYGKEQSDSGARLSTHLRRMSGAVSLRSIYALMASTGTTALAWAITLTKGTECETDEENMERTSGNVRCW